MAAVSDKCHDTLYSKYTSSTSIPETDGGPGWHPSADQVEQFRMAGCMIVRKFITTEEHKRLRSECDREDGVKQFAFERDDGEGRKSKMSLWYTPGEDLTGACGRSERAMAPADAFVGGPVYHHHTKLIMKDARTGGRFAPHQDRGYWHSTGMLRPHACTLMVALDDADAENGCLQVWPGSHQCGVLPHGSVGGQTGLLPKFAEAVARDYERHNVVLRAGDACYFHCDLVHVSQRNGSDRRRWCFLVAFNRKDNEDRWRRHPASSLSIERSPDDAFMKVPCGLPVSTAVKDFMDFEGKTEKERGSIDGGERKGHGEADVAAASGGKAAPSEQVSK